MNVVKQNIDDLSALLKIQIEKSDYESNVKKTLNNYRRKAEIKGFRVGMAPMSLIQKMYGRSALLDEINKLISESMSKYIETEKIDILGEPIPNDDKQKPIDWDNQNDFEFVYEIGLAPKCEVKVNKQTEIPFYKITVGEKEKKKHVENIQQRFGKLEEGKNVGKDDIFKADFTQECEKGIQVLDTYVSMRQLAETDQKEQFLKLKVGDSVEIDIEKTYKTDEERAQILKMKKEELSGINPNFKVTVKEIKTFKKAKVDQNLFDMAYGKDICKSEDEFMQRVSDEIAKAYEEESLYKFALDAREKFIEKTDMQLPESFLKRWLLLINEGKLTQEQLDKDFGTFAKDLKWQIIRDKIAKENEFKVGDDDMKEQARKLAKYQLSQYGMVNLTEEQTEGFVSRILEDKKQLRGIAEKVLDDKVFSYLRESVKLDEKEISVEEFEKLFDKRQ